MDLKDIVGRLSKLKYELQTDKPLTAVEDCRSDSKAWNIYLQTQKYVNRYYVLSIMC